MTPRPLGIAILSTFDIACGALVLVLMLALVPIMRGEWIGPVDDPGLAVLAALACLVGVGMWQGARWAWWLVALSFGYAILSQGLAMALSGGVPQAELLESIGYFVVNSLLLLYLFKPNVVAYFGVGGVSSRARLLRLAVAAAAIVLIVDVTFA